MVITFGRVPHKILCVTEVERGELVNLFTAHPWPDIYNLETHTNQETKGLLGAKWCFSLLMLITAMKTFYPTLSWNVNAVGISMWNGETMFGLLESLLLKLIWRGERKQMMAQEIKRQGRQREAGWLGTDQKYRYSLSLKVRKIVMENKVFIKHKTFLSINCKIF